MQPELRSIEQAASKFLYLLGAAALIGFSYIAYLEYIKP